MQQAVLRHFSDKKASYRFTNRSADTQFSLKCVERFRTAVSRKWLFAYWNIDSPIRFRQILPTLLWRRRRKSGSKKHALISRKSTSLTCLHIVSSPNKSILHLIPRRQRANSGTFQSKFLDPGLKPSCGKSPSWPVLVKHTFKLIWLTGTTLIKKVLLSWKQKKSNNAYQISRFRRGSHFLKLAVCLASSARVGDGHMPRKTGSCKVLYEPQGRSVHQESSTAQVTWDQQAFSCVLADETRHIWHKSTALNR